MSVLYRLGIRLYGGLIWAAAPFVPKARAWVQGRKEWADRLAAFAEGNPSIVWMHCSSVGEFEDSRVVWEQLRAAWPQTKFALTFFSSSGYEHFIDKPVADGIFYLPLDTRHNARRFLDLLQPQVVFFSRSDLWRNVLVEARRRGLPSYLLGLRMDANSPFLKNSARSHFEACFRAFTHIYAQNETTRQLLESELGITAVSVVGNARIDRIANAATTAPDFPRVKEFVGDHFCVIVGSSVSLEEVYALQLATRPEFDPVRWLLVPHEIHRDELKLRTLRLQDQEALFTEDTPLKDTHRVLWIDTVGHLKHLYAYADLAIVGGGFDKIGIHSILEPALYGLPIWFGPNHRNYPEALDLMALGGATVFESIEELAAVVHQHLKEGVDPTLKSQIKGYVRENTGASTRTLEDLLSRHPELALKG